MNFIEKFFSKYPQEKNIKRFKQICLAEAISWFFLFTAMIWIRTNPTDIFPIVYISTIGSIHGLFFTLYLLFLPAIRKIYNWDDEDFVFSLMSAFFPFATIWVDKKLARFDRE
jgi:integral membrane protein